MTTIICTMLGFTASDTSAQGTKRGSGPPKKAITQSEADEFGKALIEAVEKGDLEQTSRLVSWKELVDRATNTPDLPELKVPREAYIDTITQQQQKPGSMYGMISEGVKTKVNTYRYIRSDIKDKEPYVLFRLKFLQNGSLNYHKLYLMRDSDGHLVAGDIYVLTSAERLSEALHRGWMQTVNKVILKNGKNNAKIAAIDAGMKAIVNVVELVKLGKNQEALAEYRKLPEASRKSKDVLLIRLNAANNVSNEEYIRAADDFRKFHPHDPAVDFLMIDGHISRKDFDKAMGCVDRTIAKLGEDSALLGIRANVFVQMEKFPEAVQTIKAAIAAEPDLSDPYLAALDIVVAAKDHDETLDVLTNLKQKFGFQIKDLREVPIFAEFVKTPQYKKWQDSQTK